MGSWGAGVFQNDDAGDFSDRVQRSGLRVVRAALKKAAERPPHKELELDDCAAALVSGAVVAAARGHFVAEFPDDLRGKLDAIRAKLVKADVDQALSAVARVGENSEMRELFTEGGAEPWRSVLKDLTTKLKLAPVALPATTKAKRMRVTAGDICAIPLGPGRYAIAKVLYVSERFKQVMQFAVYPMCTATPVLPQKVLGKFVIKMYSYTLLISKGHWPRIGHADLTPEERILELRIITESVWEGDKLQNIKFVWQGDNMIRKATKKDIATIDSDEPRFKVSAEKDIWEALGFSRADFPKG